jgi:hypothetical protein
MSEADFVSTFLLKEFSLDHDHYKVTYLLY